MVRFITLKIRKMWFVLTVRDAVVISANTYAKLLRGFSPAVRSTNDAPMKCQYCWAEVENGQLTHSEFCLDTWIEREIKLIYETSVP
jgi:hypothetical protein